MPTDPFKWYFILGQIEVVYDASIPSKVVLLSIWSNMAITNSCVDATVSEIYQGVLQEVLLHSCGIFDKLNNKPKWVIQCLVFYGGAVEEEE